MSDKKLFVFVGVYNSKEDAEADYDVLKDLHRQKVVGSYDVAVISKDDDGKVHVSKHEKPTQHGAWSGLGVGALIGVIFPPSVVAMGALGAVTGGLIGHFRHGMPRSDMKELGEALEEGQASLVVIGEDKLDEAVAKELKRMNKQIEREIQLDAHETRKQLDGAIDDALKTS
jgi:uncharacterized membrane protein